MNLFTIHIFIEDDDIFDEKYDKEFNDPLENYDQIIQEVQSKYEQEQDHNQEQPRFEIN